MVKFLGLILLVFSGTALGYIQSKKLYVRVKFLEEFLSFLIFIQTQVRFNAGSLIDILQSYKNEKTLLLFISECINNSKQGISFDVAWEESLKKIPEHNGLKKEDINLLSKFGMGLGVSDIEGQINHCELHKKLIEERLNTARDEAKKKGKLYLILGISSGLGLALIII